MDNSTYNWSDVGGFENFSIFISVTSHEIVQGTNLVHKN